MIIPSHRGVSMLPERCREVYGMDAQGQEPSLVEQEPTRGVGFLLINRGRIESSSQWKSTAPLGQ